jgi:hypothetical protein
MRRATGWEGVTIRLEDNLIAVSRRISRNISRIVMSQLLRRIAAYERSQRYCALKPLYAAPSATAATEIVS